MTESYKNQKYKKRRSKVGLFFVTLFCVALLSLYIINENFISGSMYLYYCIPVVVVSLLFMLFKASFFASSLLFFATVAVVSVAFIHTYNIGYSILYFSDIVMAVITGVGVLLGIMFEVIRRSSYKSEVLKLERKQANQAILEIQGDSQKAIATMATQLEQSKSEIEALKKKISKESKNAIKTGDNGGDVGLDKGETQQTAKQQDQDGQNVIAKGKSFLMGMFKN